MLALKIFIIEIINNMKALLLNIIIFLNINLAIADNCISLIGQIPGGNCQAIIVKDNLAFIGNGNSLEILNISQLSSPSILSKLILTDCAKRIYMDKNILYVILEHKDIVTVDINNSKKPIQLNTFSTNTPANDLIIYNDHAFIAENGGLNVIDLSNLSSPTSIYYIDDIGRCTAIDQKDSLFYVGCISNEFNGFRIFKLKNDKTLVEIGKYQNLEWDQRWQNIADVVVNNNYAFIASINYGLGIIDISDPKSPEFIGEARHHATRICLQDTFVCTFDQNFLTICDIKAPESPTIIGSYNFLWWGEKGKDFYIQDHYAFIASQNGYITVNIQNPHSIYAQSFYKTGGLVKDILIRNEYLYVLHKNWRLVIYHKFDVMNFQKIGVCDFVWKGDRNDLQPIHLNLSKDYLYISCDDAGLLIIDIADPSAPKQVNIFTSPNFDIFDVYVNSNIAYIGTSKGLKLLDVSNALDISEIEFSSSMGKSGSHIFCDANYIILTPGFCIFDVVNPKEPEYICQLQEPSVNRWANELFILNDLLYVPHRKGGIDVLDINDPTNPIMLGSCEFNKEPTDQVWDIDISNSYAYIAQTFALHAINIENPENLFECGSFSTPSAQLLWAVDVQNEHIYAAAAFAGVYIFKNNFYTDISRTVMSKPKLYFSNYPNPFNTNTKILFDLVKADIVSIQIYDIRGQLIKYLIKNKLIQSGHYFVNWDGRDEYGNLVSSGVYILTLEKDKAILSVQKVILIK